MRVLAALLLALTGSAVFPATAALPPPVAQALAQAGVPAEAVSIYLQRLDGDAYVVRHQATRALNPASTMKLLTTYAGLELLGPAYRWRTEIYRRGEVRDGVLRGDLIIKGYGSPEWMQQDIWRALSDLRQTGLREIQGDLLLDESYFAPEARDPGAFDHEPYRAYNAVPAALVSNLNAISFEFGSDDRAVWVTASPALPEVRVVNRLKPIKAACAGWRNALDYAVQLQDDGTAAVIFSGDYPAQCGEKYLDLSPFERADYTYYLFRLIWRQLGGTISGGVKTAPLPPGAVRIAQSLSPPLSDLIRRINKYSNNLMTRQLLLTLGAEKVGAPGSETGGAEAIRGWLAGKGLDFPELVLENGAGLSRVERITAEHLGMLLADAYRSPLMAELMSSLPLLATDGTLMRRLRESAVRGRAHLKTGSLNQVRTLAGYLQDEKNRRWAVVFMVNHARADASRTAQDALLEWVYQQP